MYSTIQTPVNVKMISCSKCQGDMPELRKTQYGYDFCVNCSDGLNLVGRKRALPIQMGEGDHSWTETVIMEESDYLKYEQGEIIKNKKSKDKLSDFDIDDDERDLQGPFKIINNQSDEED
jgi:hypothetical protein